MSRTARVAGTAAVLMALAVASDQGAYAADQPKIDNLQQLFARLKSCWKSPAQERGKPGIEITVLVTFTRSGDILGEPKITYESKYATDDERLMYRIAVAETLQRCTPLPLTNGLGNALAGRPFRIRFDDRRTRPT